MAVSSSATAVAVASAPESAIPSSAEVRDDRFTENTMREYFAGQKKVSIKTQKDEWVQVNGFTFIIKGGERVEVPEDIAKILDDAGRI